MKLTDNYDMTTLEIRIKPKLRVRVGRLTIENKIHGINHSIDLGRDKLIRLRDELDRIIDLI